MNSKPTSLDVNTSSESNETNTEPEQLEPSDTATEPEEPETPREPEQPSESEEPETPTEQEEPETTTESEEQPTETEILNVDLREAITKNLVQTMVSGDSLEYVDMTLRSTSDQSLEVTIPVGTIFESQSTGLQNMVVIEPAELYLESRDSVASYSVSVACTNMELDVPDDYDTLGLSTVDAEGDLSKLLSLSNFGDETFRVQQFAIWTITDNPPRD